MLHHYFLFPQLSKFNILELEKERDRERESKNKQKFNFMM